MLNHSSAVLLLCLVALSDTAATGTSSVQEQSQYTILRPANPIHSEPWPTLSAGRNGLETRRYLTSSTQDTASPPHISTEKSGDENSQPGSPTHPFGVSMVAAGFAGKPQGSHFRGRVSSKASSSRSSGARFVLSYSSLSQYGGNRVREPETDLDDVQASAGDIQPTYRPSGPYLYRPPSPSWYAPAHEEYMEVSNRALLEEADADSTGQTHCLDVPRCSYVPIRKECRGHERYRTADGTCNNLQHPLLGSAFQPFKRYIPARYDDGAGSPRAGSVQLDQRGRPLSLPSPRLVSRTVHLIKDAPSHESGLLMQFGQFVDHDITGTSSTIGTKGAIICCGKNRQKHEDCLPITVPAGDTHYTDTNCISFVRSLPVADSLNRTLVPREQRNEVTSFLDASVVYGSAEDQTVQLRTFKQGMLKYSDGQMLPLEAGGCAAPDGLCLMAGDTRVNEVPGLSALHVLFHRQHNLLARRLLSLVHPGPATGHEARTQRAVDEAVFRIARRILSAQLQHVTYSQWLPLVLGPFAMRHYGLDGEDLQHRYDSNRDPRVANVFATAAFRFGHTLVPDWFPIGDRQVPLPEAFNNPSWVRQDVEKVLEGVLHVAAENRDQFFVSGLRNRLFETTPRRGLDLVAMNIQRGRDHGLAPYASWRSSCGLPTLVGFNDTALGSAGPALREVYLSVDDIDLFTGAIAEPALSGAIVGPTLACLIGRQFSDLKAGDRFFYTTSGPEGFTKEQLTVIRETTMAALLCSNTQSLKSVQKNPFLAPSKSGYVKSCINDLVTCVVQEPSNPVQADEKSGGFSGTLEAGAV